MHSLEWLLLLRVYRYGLRLVPRGEQWRVRKQAPVFETIDRKGYDMSKNISTSCMNWKRGNTTSSLVSRLLRVERRNPQAAELFLVK